DRATAHLKYHEMVQCDLERSENDVVGLRTRQNVARAVGADHQTRERRTAPYSQKASGMSVIEMTRTLAGHTGAVISVAFSPDGALIATASEDTTAKVWDVATGETAYTL